ncbi:acyl-CoA thioesterase [Stygiobacter electus]|uniref:Thioesterase family protein n=1 Tax=Stygiobacter electus TaxID=3032292 RepID=A0AAE3NU27_9BACT|nr:thioesterase family protein [Stygiobacter electus]MDF1610901.1 thioesterase family protein [Stygiobacter electus]
MITYTTEIRVRYADTDKMQFVYNGKYLEYFEVGRTELFRSIGFPYRMIENEGYQLPLIEAGLKYISPATYDDLLLITATVNEHYTAKPKVEYQIVNKETGNLIVEGFTTHVFIKVDTKKAVRPPKIYIDALAKYFQK